MTKELVEINAELTEIEARANALTPLAETATSEEIEQRANEINEIDTRKAELMAQKSEFEAREATVKAVAENKMKAEEIKPEERGEKIMTNAEIRNSKEYIHAFANYIKNDNDKECRSLLTENVSGTVPVPDFVDKIVRTAWDNEQVMALVNKTNLKGNVRVGFELSATDAVVHTEGAAAPSEETLTLGIVTMVPTTIKKWITISDEVLDLDDGAFLEYIYKELGYRIAKKAADSLIGLIVAAPTTATATAVRVKEVATAGIYDVVNALSLLSDEATNPTIVMNKQSYAYYKGLAMAANYAIDPFEGIKVVFNNTLAVADGTTTGTYMIVGDFGSGAQANYPNGQGITFKYDDLSLAESDLVKIVGRTPVALGLVACDRFVRVVKA